MQRARGQDQPHAPDGARGPDVRYREYVLRPATLGAGSYGAVGLGSFSGEKVGCLAFKRQKRPDVSWVVCRNHLREGYTMRQLAKAYVQRPLGLLARNMVKEAAAGDKAEKTLYPLGELLGVADSRPGDAPGAGDPGSSSGVASSSGGGLADGEAGMRSSGLNCWEGGFQLGRSGATSPAEKQPSMFSGDVAAALASHRARCEDLGLRPLRAPGKPSYSLSPSLLWDFPFTPMIDLFDGSNVSRAGGPTGDLGDSLILAMPALGGDLTSFVCSGAFEEYDIPQTVALMYRLLRAVAYLHSLGHSHRDLKAGNVLLDQEGRVVLCDFGMAKNERLAALPHSEGVHCYTKGAGREEASLHPATDEAAVPQKATGNSPEAARANAAGKRRNPWVMPVPRFDRSVPGLWSRPLDKVPAPQDQHKVWDGYVPINYAPENYMYECSHIPPRPEGVPDELLEIDRSFGEMADRLQAEKRWSRAGEESSLPSASAEELSEPCGDLSVPSVTGLRSTTHGDATTQMDSAWESLAHTEMARSHASGLPLSAPSHTVFPEQRATRAAAAEREPVPPPVTNSQLRADPIQLSDAQIVTPGAIVGHSADVFQDTVSTEASQASVAPGGWASASVPTPARNGARADAPREGEHPAPPVSTGLLGSATSGEPAEPAWLNGSNGPNVRNGSVPQAHQSAQPALGEVDSQVSPADQKWNDQTHYFDAFDPIHSQNRGKQRVDYTGLHGTLWWRSPEQILHSTLAATGYAADNWALGCILLEMIWGLPVFRTEERDERKGGWEVLALISHFNSLGASPYYHSLLSDPDLFRSMDSRGGWDVFCTKTRDLFKQGEAVADAVSRVSGCPIKRASLPSVWRPQTFTRTLDMAHPRNFLPTCGEETERVILRLILLRFSRTSSPQRLFQTVEGPEEKSSQGIVDACLAALQLTRGEFRVLRGIASVIAGLLRVDPSERMTAGEALTRFPFNCVPLAANEPTPVRFKKSEDRNARAECKVARVLRALHLSYQQSFFGVAGAAMKAGPIDSLVLHGDEV